MVVWRCVCLLRLVWCVCLRVHVLSLSLCRHRLHSPPSQTPTTKHPTHTPTNTPPPKKTKLSRTFKPDFKLIKKRIEDLIAREYLERDKDNPQIFKYLA